MCAHIGRTKQTQIGVRLRSTVLHNDANRKTVLLPTYCAQKTTITFKVMQGAALGISRGKQTQLFSATRTCVALCDMASEVHCRSGSTPADVI